MIGEKSSPYKLPDELGEVPKSPTNVLKRADATLRTPLLYGGGRRSCL